MKFTYPEINVVFDTDKPYVNTLIIENQGLMLRLIEDISEQLSGNDGKAVVSENNKVLAVSKKVELLTQFVPFDLNQKTLLTKINSELEKNAVSPEYFSKTQELLGLIETLLMELSFDYACDVSFPKLSIGSVIKAGGLEIFSQYDNLGEKIIDYMELVNEFIGHKMFVTVNLRSYLNDADVSGLMKTVIDHGFHLLMIESSEHELLPEERRVIVDSDLCEICCN